MNNKKAIQKRKLFWAFPGRKGMMDDLFDLFFTVIAAIFLLFFINAALLGGLNQKEVSLNEMVKSVNNADNFLMKYKTHVHLLDKEVDFKFVKKNMESFANPNKKSANVQLTEAYTNPTKINEK